MKISKMLITLLITLLGMNFAYAGTVSTSSKSLRSTLWNSSSSSSSGSIPIGETITFKAKRNNKLVANTTTTSNKLRAEGSSIGIEDKYGIIDRGSSVVVLRAKRDNKYVATEVSSNSKLFAIGSSIGIEDEYEWKSNSDGTFSLKSRKNNKWVAATSNNNWELRAEGNSIGDEDKYTFQIQ